MDGADPGAPRRRRPRHRAAQPRHASRRHLDRERDERGRPGRRGAQRRRRVRGAGARRLGRSGSGSSGTRSRRTTGTTTSSPTRCCGSRSDSLDEFVDAGSDSFLVHWEGNNNLHRTLQRIKALCKRVGIVINPATPASVLEDFLGGDRPGISDDCRSGFWRPAVSDTTLPKVKRSRYMIERINPACELELDGGIDPETAAMGVAAGANVLVAGTSCSTTGWVYSGHEQTAWFVWSRRHRSKQIDRATEGDSDAIRNGRSGKNGRQHGSTPYQGRPRMRGLRQVTRNSQKNSSVRKPWGRPRCRTSSRSCGNRGLSA